MLKGAVVRRRIDSVSDLNFSFFRFVHLNERRLCSNKCIYRYSLGVNAIINSVLDFHIITNTILI